MGQSFWHKEPPNAAGAWLMRGSSGYVISVNVQELHGQLYVQTGTGDYHVTAFSDAEWAKPAQ